MENVLLHDYASQNESFDTEEFKKITDILLGMSDSQLFTWHTTAADALYRHKQGEFLCSLEDGIHFLESACTNPYVNVCKLYGTDDRPLPVKCYFICINAATDNIPAAISYIETLCGYLMQKENTMMLKDKSKYMDTKIVSGLYDLHSGGEIVFAVPDGLYMEEWEKYKAGSIGFNEMVKEADRKVQMYKEEQGHGKK